jgi:AcrR family transcriptional regulator
MTHVPIQGAPRPRKTPSQARSRATIDAVLAAAAHILETGGVAAFNTNAAAERAGVSIGSLYQYFPNKDAILVALIERRFAAFADSLAEVADSADGASLADDLRRLLQRAVAWHDMFPRLSRVLDAEEGRLEEHLDLRVEHGRLDAILGALLGRHRHALRCPDLDLATRHVALITRVLMESEARFEKPDWPAATERAVGAVMGYLSIRAPGDASRLTQSAAPD